MNKRLEKKLAKLPVSPGVYFHKDAKGEIIYIGKAASLRNRVRQYFQKSRAFDPKTDILVSEIADIDWTEVETEADALFLEAELVRRYMPRFNILLRDDKSQLYVRIDYKSAYPTVTMVRRPLDDEAQYFGPYINGFEVKKALRYLRRAFPYATSRSVGAKRANLHYHLGLDPGLEEGRTSLEDYRANLRKLIQYLRGERVSLSRQIEREMNRAAKAQDFEVAARLRNQLRAMAALNRQILFSDRELQAAANDQALVQLAELLGLAQPPRRIEGFDISHMQGSDTVASMVVFSSGLPYKAGYRKFKMRTLGNDDFLHMSETISRRLRDENRHKWGLADLVLIDGGKGQLGAAIAARDRAGLSQLPMIGLAKRQEEIIIHADLSVPGRDAPTTQAIAQQMGALVTSSDKFISILLPDSSPVVKLLQRIRDESHRFAVSYLTYLKRTRQTTSVLDDIPGVGPLTRKKLMRQFGSTRAIMQAETEQLQQVLGPKKGEQLARYLSSYKT